MKLKKKSFIGGVHPPEAKEETKNVPVKALAMPQKVVLPMSMHIGAPCQPLVKRGEEVYLGQKIGESGSFISAPIHASVSGKVTAVEKRLCISGKYEMAVEIQSDGLDTPDPGIQPYGDFHQYTADELVRIIREAGIVGLGGAAFPTHAKLTVKDEKKADVVILNGAECEPYLTADYHLMMDHAERILQGLRIIMHAVNAPYGCIGIELNKVDAIDVLLKTIAPEDNIDIVPLKVKYPQGAEKQLINAITGKMVPPGKLPIDIGVVVSNVGTAAQIAETFETGMPLFRRNITCAGDAIASPATVEARIGTSVSEIIEQCGGFKSIPKKVLSGGPMMGVTMPDVAVPVVKGTSGIVCLSAEKIKTQKKTNCIRCDKCVSVCPMHLQPLYFVLYAEKNQWDRCKNNRVMNCIECGSCSYICPSKQEIVPSIRVAKSFIRNQAKKVK